jgi:hypothetical protein
MGGIPTYSIVLLGPQGSNVRHRGCPPHEYPVVVRANLIKGLRVRTPRRFERMCIALGDRASLLTALPSGESKGDE